MKQRRQRAAALADGERCSSLSTVGTSGSVPECIEACCHTLSGAKLYDNNVTHDGFRFSAINHFESRVLLGDN